MKNFCPLPSYFLRKAFFLFIFLFILVFVVPSTAYAADRYWVGGSDGANTNDTSNWATSAGACGVGGGASVPGSSDNAIFTSSCTNGATLNANLNVYGLTIQSGYSGTITQGSGITLTTGSGNYTQADGVFSGSNASITHSQDFILNGGTFTSTSGTMVFQRDFHVTSGTFNHNSGNVTLSGSVAGADLACNNITFNTFTLNKDGHDAVIGSDCILPIAGTNPTIKVGVINTIYNNGTININGNLTITGRQYVQNAGAVLNISGTDITSNILTLNGGSITGNVDTINLHGDLNNSGNVLPDGLTLSMTGSGGISLSCGDVTWGSVIINKSGNGLTIGSNCTLPISGTNPTIAVGSNDSITNNGVLQITGNPTIQARDYNFNSTGTLSITGDTATFSRNLVLQSGTFPANITTLIVGGDLNNTNNVIGNGLDLTINSGNWTTFNCGNSSFDSLTISKTSGRFTVASNCTIGDFAYSATGSTDFYNPASAYTWTVTGDFTHSSSVDFGAANVSVLFGGSSTQTINKTSTGLFESPLKVNKAGGLIQLANNLTITTEACTIIEGIFYANGNDLNCSGGITVENGGTFRLIGDEVINGTFTGNLGAVVEYKGDGDSVADSYQVKDWEYADLKVNFTDSDDDLGVDAIVALNDSLVAYWNMDESSGTNVADSSSNSNDATATAGVTRVTGYSGSGYALSFDGSSGDYVTVSNSASLEFGAPLTISAWVKTSVTGWKWIMSRADWNYGLGVSNTGHLVWTVSGGNNRVSTGYLSDGEWHHVVATHDGTDLVLYMDGNQVGSWNDVVVSSSTSPIYLGRYANTNENWNGQIDDTRIYSRVITSTEINHIYRDLPESITSLDVNGDIVLSSGGFTAPLTLTLAGDFNKTSGTFTHNNGTLTLDGTSQSVYGSSTFYNLTKTVTSADTLTFVAGTTQTIANTLALNGASGNLLSLRSLSTGTRWNIDPQGTRNLSYLDVQDSNNINATAITSSGNNITDSGNNINWGFDIVAPVITLGSVSPDPGTDTTPTITGSVVDASGTVTSVEYQVDGTGGSWTSCLVDDGGFDESSESFTCTVGLALGDGTHTIYVRATDNSSNTTGGGSESSDEFVVDTGNPTAPGTPSTTTPTNSTSQTWSWSAASDSITSISSYAWRILNSLGSSVATGTTSATSVITNMVSGSYTFYVKAIDQAGNESGESSGGLVVEDLDTEDPAKTSLKEPKNKAFINTNKPDFTFEVTTDDVEVTNYKLKIDDEVLVEEINPDSPGGDNTRENDEAVIKYDDDQVTVTIKNSLSDGEHSWEIVAYDEAGNSSDSDSRKFTVDTDNPSVKVTQIGLTKKTTNLNDSEQIYTITTQKPIFYGETEKDSELIVEVGDYSCSTKTKSDVAWNCRINELMPVGTYEVLIKVTDKAGNTSELSNITLFITLSTLQTEVIETNVSDNKKSDDLKETNAQKEKEQKGNDSIDKEEKAEEKLEDSNIFYDTYDVSLKIVDDSGNPLPFVKVTMFSKPKETITNENGIAYFANVEPGEHTVVVEHDDKVGEQKIKVEGESEEISYTIAVEPANPFLNIWVILVISGLVLALVLLYIKHYRHVSKNKRNYNI